MSEVFDESRDLFVKFLQFVTCLVSCLIVYFRVINSTLLRSSILGACSKMKTRSQKNRGVSLSADDRRDSSSQFISREEFEKRIQDIQRFHEEEIRKIKEAAIEMTREAAVIAAREAMLIAVAEINARSNTQNTDIVPTFSNACNRPSTANIVSQSTSGIVENRLEQEFPSRRRIRKELKPESFDGTGSWDDYIKQFDVISEYNEYSDQEKAAVLVSSLRGSAREILLGMAREEIKDLKKVREELDVAFSKERGVQFSFAEFLARKQRENEKLWKFALDLKRLVRLAHPGIDEGIMDKQACSQFIHGISNNDIRRNLMLENITSLRSALRRAQEIQAVHLLEIKEKQERIVRKIGVDRSHEKIDSFCERNSEVSGNESFSRSIRDLTVTQKNKHSRKRKCWCCRELDHIKNDCPNRR